MKPGQQQPGGNVPEQRERVTQQLTTGIGHVLILEDQAQLDRLIELGFAWEEAILLLGMREHLYENVEMRQRMAEDSHIQFARWLYEHGEISEGGEANSDDDKKPGNSACHS